jgi:hypothetical protein
MPDYLTPENWKPQPVERCRERSRTDRCCICGFGHGLVILSAYRRLPGSRYPEYAGSMAFCCDHNTSEWRRIGEALLDGRVKKQ